MDKTTLEHLLSRYDWWIGVSTAAVAVGILGEYVAHFVFEEEARKNKLEMAISILFGALVLFGVGGEWILGARLSTVSMQLQSIADVEVAQANRDAGIARQAASDANDRASANEKEAARLNKIAEQEHLARIKIESEVTNTGAKQKLLEAQQQKSASVQKDIVRRETWRMLDVKSFVNSLNGKPKGTVVLWYVPNDTEAYSLARQLYQGLGAPNKDGDGAGWKVYEPVPIPDKAGEPGLDNPNAPADARFSGSRSRSGITILSKTAKPFENDVLGAFTDALGDSLNRAGAGGAGYLITEISGLPDGYLIVVVQQRQELILRP